MSNDVLIRLQHLISRKILTDRSRRRVTAETRLLSFGLNLDSVAVLQLLMEVEREFGVELRDNELSVELFKTVGTLAEVIARKLPADEAMLDKGN